MNKRDPYFDNLKFILILLVVLGHFTTLNLNNLHLASISNIIYSFHMPIFIFISGYFSKHIDRQRKIEIDQLWSRIGIEDYSAFFYKYEIDKNNTIISNPGQTTPGTWYPTSHKRISYDLLLLGTVTGPIIKTFESTVKSLFYTLAPIHWVLEQIVASIPFHFFATYSASFQFIVGSN